MAERRMFAKTIVLSDAFLDMPVGARALYMMLGMVADDDGIVNNPRSVMRQCGVSDDDMRVLLSKRFVLYIGNGLLAIKHWHINNYLRSDRYTETKYLDEKARLSIDKNGAYTFNGDVGIPDGIQGGIPNTVYPGKDSIDKNSIGKDSKDTMSGRAGRGASNNAAFSSEFDTLWSLYPRKEGKIDAKKHYIKARKEGITFETIKAGLLNYIDCIKREGREGTKIKIGSTWFNQRCWEDEYTTVNQKTLTTKDIAKTMDFTNFLKEKG